MTFFLFHSIYIIKDYRYFVGMAPSTVYFLMRGFFWAVSQFGFKFKGHNITQLAMASFLIILVLFSTLSSFSGIHEANIELQTLNGDIITASDWFVQYDPEYKNKVIYSDFWPYSDGICA
nr:hypothetical protein [Methanobacterium formicicum]